MRTYTYLLVIAFLLVTASCSEQVIPDTAVGYLRVEGIELTCDTEMLPISRGVDAGLKLEIWQGESCVRSYEPGAEELAKRIVLPIGDYVLKAFTLDQAEAPNDEAGVPIYSTEYPFSILSEDVVVITVKVPQINVGVLVEYSDAFKANFTDYFVVVSSPTGRQAAISDDAAEIFYFNLPTDNGSLTYTLTATNADGEVMTSEKRSIPKTEAETLKARNYKIQIDLGQ